MNRKREIKRVKSEREREGDKHRETERKRKGKSYQFMSKSIEYVKCLVNGRYQVTCLYVVKNDIESLSQDILSHLIITLCISLLYIAHKETYEIYVQQKNLCVLRD